MEDLKDYLRELVYSAIGEVVSKESTHNDVLLSRYAVSKRMNVDVSTLWRWDRSGYLKAVRIGRSVYYKLYDVEALERGEVRTYKA